MNSSVFCSRALGRDGKFTSNTCQIKTVLVIQFGTSEPVKGIFWPYRSNVTKLEAPISQPANLIVSSGLFMVTTANQFLAR